MNNDFDVVLANETDLELPISEDTIQACIEELSKGEALDFSLVEVVFVSQEEIVAINTKHLNKTYITDIITFDYTEEDQPIEGTLFCCAQRIIEQADEFNEPIKKEFCRIIIHGLLHLCGYQDTTPEKKAAMTAKEDHYLAQVKA